MTAFGQGASTEHRDSQSKMKMNNHYFFTNYKYKKVQYNLQNATLYL